MKFTQKLFHSLFTFLLLIVQACNFSEPKIEEGVIITSTSNISNPPKEDALTHVQKFLKHTLGENLRSHEFDFSLADSLHHFKLFKTDGLLRITAFSDKTFPKKIEPSRYEHYTLFVFEYSTETAASEALDKLTKASQTLLKTQEGNFLDSLNTFTKYLHFSSKSGGLICQKDTYIFSLVETCRNTPLEGTWPEYEDVFINFLLLENESVLTLNADCGQMEYRLERKTKSAENSITTE